MNPLIAFESEGSFWMASLKFAESWTHHWLGWSDNSQTHQHSLWLAQQGSQMPSKWLGWWRQDSFLFFLCPKIQNEITLPFLFFCPPVLCPLASRLFLSISFPAVTKMNKATYSKTVCWPLGLRSPPQQKGSSSEMNVHPWSTSGMRRKTNDELFPIHSTQQAEKQQFEISKYLGVSQGKAGDWQSKVPVKH